MCCFSGAWQQMDDAFVRVLARRCECACHRLFQAEVCVSSPQPHVWWIPLLTATGHRELLPRSGADRFQHRQYISLAGERKSNFCESRHSNQMEELKQIQLYYWKLMLILNGMIRFPCSCSLERCSLVILLFGGMLSRLKSIYCISAFALGQII